MVNKNSNISLKDRQKKARQFIGRLTRQRLDHIIQNPQVLNQQEIAEFISIGNLQWLKDNWQFLRRRILENPEDPVSYEEIVPKAAYVFTNDTTLKVYNFGTIHQMFTKLAPEGGLTNPYNPSQKFHKHNLINLPLVLFSKDCDKQANPQGSNVQSKLLIKS